MSPQLVCIALWAIVSFLCTLQLALAHGGELHDWTFSSPGKNFVRYKLATCAASSFAAPGTMPLTYTSFEESKPAEGVQVTSGLVNVWVFLDGNCTDRPSTTLEVLDLTLQHADGSPYSGRSSYAFGYSGNCSNPGDYYRDTSARGNDRMNLAWWSVPHDHNTEGVFTGSAPNTWVARQPNDTKPPAGGALTSLVVIPNPADGGPLCCNLEWAAPPPKSFFSQGSYCFAAPPPPKKKKSNKKKNKKAKTSPPPSAADDHDHGDHVHRRFRRH